MGWKGARGAGWPATWGREAPEDSGGGRGGQVREGVVEDVPFERDLEKHRTSLAASLAGRRPWSTCSIPGRWVWSPSRWWSHRRFKGRLSAVSCGTLGSQRSTLPSLGWRRLLREGAPQVVFRPRSPGATSLWAGDQSRSLPKWPPDDKRISALGMVCGRRCPSPPCRRSAAAGKAEGTVLGAKSCPGQAPPAPPTLGSHFLPLWAGGGE
nr:tetraspanin-4 isoform X2 [Manis javanica]